MTDTATKHTPGPWSKRRLKRSVEIYWPQTGKKVAIVGLSEFVDNAGSEANAALITTAPDMLAALNAVDDAYESGNDSPKWHEAIEKVRAAIAKAESR